MEKINQFFYCHTRNVTKLYLAYKGKISVQIIDPGLAGSPHQVSDVGVVGDKVHLQAVSIKHIRLLIHSVLDD